MWLFGALWELETLRNFTVSQVSVIALHLKNKDSTMAKALLSSSRSLENCHFLELGFRKDCDFTYLEEC